MTWSLNDQGPCRRHSGGAGAPAIYRVLFTRDVGPQGGRSSGK